MKQIKQFDYKDFPCELNMSEHDGITFSCSSIGKFKSKYNKAHSNGGWDKPQLAIDSLKEVIDEFIMNAPKTYEELAEAIYDGALIWTGNTVCHIDSQLLEIIIRNFLLTQNENK